MWVSVCTQDRHILTSSLPSSRYTALIIIPSNNSFVSPFLTLLSCSSFPFHVSSSFFSVSFPQLQFVPVSLLANISLHLFHIHESRIFLSDSYITILIFSPQKFCDFVQLLNVVFVIYYNPQCNLHLLSPSLLKHQPIPRNFLYSILLIITVLHLICFLFTSRIHPSDHSFNSFLIPPIPFFLSSVFSSVSPVAAFPSSLLRTAVLDVPSSSKSDFLYDRFYGERHLTAYDVNGRALIRATSTQGR